MTNHDLALPFWEGFIASKSERRPGAVWIDLRRDPDAPMVCSDCGHDCHQVHEAGTRIIRELPMFGLPVWLRVPLRRLGCGQCGTRTERVTWLDRHARVTRAVAEFVGLWCEKLPAGRDMKAWQWGELHETLYAHTPFSMVKPLNGLFEARTVGGGSADTVNVANHGFIAAVGYRRTFGASFRQIIEFAPKTVTHLYMNSTGQSGNVFSPHYADMVEPFRKVEYTSMFDTSWDASQILHLRPAPRVGEVSSQ